MKLRLTDAARQQLTGFTVPENRVLRIDADMKGGCGISVHLSVEAGEPRRHDTTLDCGGGIIFHIDRFTERYLDEEAEIDWTKENGFTIGSSFDSGCTV